jgi:transcriptional regulator PpsR
MRPFAEPEVNLGALSATTTGTLLSMATDISLVVDANGVIRDVASSTEDLAKESFDEWLGQLWIDTVTLDSRPKVEMLLREAGSSSGQANRRHVNQVLSGGRELPLLFSALRVESGDDARPPDRAIACGRDLRATAALQQRLVEAQQAMERDYWKFRHAETRYRHLFQVASEAVLVVDSATQKILEANPAATQLLGGHGTPDLVGQSFPFGVDTASAEALNNLIAGVRATGRSDQLRAGLLDGQGTVTVSVSTYRQDRLSHLLIRLDRTHAEAPSAEAPSTSAMLLRMVQSAPDCLVVTDLEGHVVSANAAFIELAQLTIEDQARGQTLDRWLGRTGVDLSVLISNLRQRGAVRLFATTLRGESGAVTEVEISATMVTEGDQPFLGFTIRDVGRRLSSEPRPGKELPKSVDQLTELVGRVPLKDIVGETTDLIEQLCIEAALELTRDNRASAAEMLGLSRQSLYVKLRRYGLGNLGEEADKVAEK